MGESASTLPTAKDTQKESGIKLRAQITTTFRRNGIKWQSWKNMTRAAIGVADMQKILYERLYSSEEVNRIENETIFHLLQVATSEGNAAHLVDAHESGKDGHGA